jgi:hypothetical protein
MDKDIYRPSSARRCRKEAIEKHALVTSTEDTSTNHQDLIEKEARRSKSVLLIQKISLKNISHHNSRTSASATVSSEFS